MKVNSKDLAPMSSQRAMALEQLLGNSGIGSTASLSDDLMAVGTICKDKGSSEKEVYRIRVWRNSGKEALEQSKGTDSAGR